jgi:hypothetical protein
MKNFLAWLMRSRGARIGFAALLGLVRLFSPLSGGLVALVVLRHGWLEGVVTTLGASIVLAAVEAGLMHAGFLVLTLPTLLLWWLVIALALVLRRTVSLALMMEVATGLGCLAVVLFFLVNPDAEAFWTPLLKQLVLPVLKSSTGASGHDWSPVIERMALLMTGVMSASLVLGASLSVLCGRWGQAVLYNPGGFRDAFHRLRMGWIATIAASVLFVLAAVLNNIVINNLAIVLLVMFMYQGLAVIHGIAGQKKIHPVWLAGFYTVFVLEFLYVLAIVAGLGLIDNWFDIRSRVIRREPPR